MPSSNIGVILLAIYYILGCVGVARLGYMLGRSHRSDDARPVRVRRR